MKLGPVNEYNGVEQYSYSLVSESSGSSLSVLVRDVAEFEELYEEDVMEWLNANGFDTPQNNPVAVYHGEDCLYPEEEGKAVQEDDVPTVDELEIPLYTGLWYQVSGGERNV
jgi:lipocalin